MAITRRSARLAQTCPTILATRCAIPASDNTILRPLKRWTAGRARVAVPVVGIDDWSWLKGQTYRTIIGDLESHDVVELIAERSVASAGDFFARSPEVELVCRDG
jgi:transposase